MVEFTVAEQVQMATMGKCTLHIGRDLESKTSLIGHKIPEDFQRTQAIEPLASS